MALEFRISSGKVNFFGVRCGIGERQELLDALRTVNVSVVRTVREFIASGAATNFDPEKNEIYWANFTNWPEDVQSIGLRALSRHLLAAGFDDKSEISLERA